MSNVLSKYQSLTVVGLTAFSILMFELLLARMYVFFLGNVSSFIAIPITMLGLSIGTLVLHWYPKIVKESSIKIISALFLLLLAAGFFGFFHIFNQYLGLSNWLDQNPIRDAGRTMALTLIFLPAFATGGMLLSIIFKLGARYIGRLYAIDLVASATACLTTMVLLHYFGLAITISFLLVIAAISLIFIYPYRLRITVFIISLAGILFYGGSQQWFFSERFEHGILTGPYAHAEAATQLRYQWDEISRISLLHHDNQEDPYYSIIHDDGVSTVYVEPYVPEKVLETPKPFSTQVFPFLLDTPPKSALVLFAGVGRDMVRLNEFAHGKMHVTGIELSRLVPLMVTHPPYNLFNLNDFYQLPHIDYRIDEGRAFLSSSQQKYDLIFIGTNGATVSTRFGNTRRYLDTYEALLEMFDHLTPDGILFFHFTLFHRDRLEAIKKIFQQPGFANFKDSVIRIAISNQKPNLRDSYLIKPAGFTESEINRIQSVSDNAGIKVWYQPHHAHSLAKKEIEAPYDENIKLSTDNRPYSKMLDFGKFSLFPDEKKFAVPLYGLENSAEWLKIFTMLLFITLALLVVIGFYGYNPSKQKLPIYLLGYFMLTGICYMLVQISMMSKLELFFGQPIYSMTIVLTTFLVFNGIGAAFVNWWCQENPTKIPVMLLSLVTAIVIMICFLIIQELIHLIGFGLFFKAIIAIICLAPVAFLLGMYYPIGVMYTVEQGLDKLVPMTFGLTTLSSVIGSVLTLVFVINLGFWHMILIAIVGYLILSLLFSRMQIIKTT